MKSPTTIGTAKLSSVTALPDLRKLRAGDHGMPGHRNLPAGPSLSGTRRAARLFDEHPAGPGGGVGRSERLR